MKSEDGQVCILQSSCFTKYIRMLSKNIKTLCIYASYAAVYKLSLCLYASYASYAAVYKHVFSYISLCIYASYAAVYKLV